jgi:Fur family ferric uptake transcriptional regulator
MDITFLKSYLHKKGYRITNQRMAVLNAIIQAENKHLNASEIHALVKKQYPGFGLATVYKNLRVLEQEGLVNKLDLSDNTRHYEINLSEPHCHLLCLKCGHIEELGDAFYKSLYDLLWHESRFTIEKRSLVFYGYCSTCRLQL